MGLGYTSAIAYRKIASKVFPIIGRVYHHLKGISHSNYRQYVGGNWESTGLNQVGFLVRQGLKPEHYLLDIGCGAFRGGFFLMQYLDPGHYFGLEKEKKLLELGMERELGVEHFRKYQPELIHSSHFEFKKFSKKPDYAFAHSVFTHLTQDEIKKCLNRLRESSKPDIRFYATFFVGKSKYNIKISHDHYAFYYSLDEIESLAQESGWHAEEIAEWNHPANQRMFLFSLMPGR